MTRPRVVIPSADTVHATLRRCEELAGSVDHRHQAPLNRLRCLVAGYSGGEDRGAIGSRLAQWIEALQRDTDPVPLQTSDREHYIAAVWLLALCQVVSPERMGQAVALIADVDADPLLAALQRGQSTTGDEVMHPTFLEVVRSTQAAPDAARRRLATFLMNYPTNVAGFPWRGAGELGIEPVGCWSFETLALFGDNEDVMPYLAGCASLPIGLMESADKDSISHTPLQVGE